MNIFERQKAIFSHEDMARLRASTVMIAGVGGLGTVVAEGLVRLGIGGLILVDDDRVSPTDLNRQILYTAKDIGEFKTKVARERLLAIRDDVWIEAWVQRIEKKFDIPNKVNGVVDALDNWDSRFILADMCEAKGKFLVHAGLSGAFGQVASFLPNRPPKFRDVFAGAAPEEPAAFFSICAVLGGVQAFEVVKIICGRKDNLVGKLLLVDLITYHFEVISLAK
ncbi:HesA/MoeB/ThiF family protein [Thermodesulfatator autotrophicus]|uniref:THIF-type NAD/FAD binding fold domain-containing protein n=1 Tax=Thermodesulfatator autotrophicus TaxID=1795632 RepID=A0A177EBK8_9BACT|nr:HesA/MoeB/ThiF family protein [Thermodesulfatator autotrophicus]OAG28562.1 hypothetical protein TH606_00985 [Thermodesulfatator autotrophicus]